MAKDSKPADPTAKENANSKIEAIKNLIFGENIEEYDHEFESLKSEIAEKRAELMNYVDETRTELMTAIDNLSTDVNIRISDLEASIDQKTNDLNAKKVSKSTLGDLLVQMGESIKSK